MLGTKQQRKEYIEDEYGMLQRMIVLIQLNFVIYIVFRVRVAIHQLSVCSALYLIIDTR